MPFKSTEKKCKQCEQVKPVDEFYKHNTNKDGLFSKCKTCVNEKRRDRHREISLGLNLGEIEKLSRVQKFVNGVLDPSELTDEEVRGSFIIDDDGTKVDSASLREKFQPKFTKELARRLNDYIREKSPRAVEIIFEIADSDLVEPGDRFRAATWLAERVIGKTPEVLMVGRTDAPYEDIFDRVESSSRDAYRKATLESYRALEAGNDSDDGSGDEDSVIDAEVVTDEGDNGSIRDDAEERVLGSSEQLGQTETGLAASDNDDPGMDNHVENVRERISDAKQLRERIKIAQRKRFAARSNGVSLTDGLTGAPWLIRYTAVKPDPRRSGSRVGGLARFKARLVPPERQTQGMLDKINAQNAQAV
jgi:hypothetical protein